MQGGDTDRGNGIGEDIKAEKYICAVKEKKDNGGADEIKAKMNDGNALCGFR